MTTPGIQADIVREFGVSKNAISKLVKAGDHRIIHTPSGKIDIDATVKALKDSGFPKIKRKKKKYIEPEAEAEGGEEHTIDYSKPLGIQDTRALIEKHKAFHQAEKVRIENQEKLKTLINVDEVADCSFELWRKLRDEIQAIKDRCAIKVRSAQSDHEAEQILHDETHRILNTIVSDFEKQSDEDIKKKLLTLLTAQMQQHYSLTQT